MPYNPNSKKNLLPFRPGHDSRRPKGRPKLVGQVLKGLHDKGYEAVSKSQILDTYATLLNLNFEELKLLLNDKEQPVLTLIVAKAMIERKGSFDNIERIIDRAHGTPQQNIKHSGQITEIVVTKTVVSKKRE